MKEEWNSYPKCKIGRYEILLLPEHQVQNYRNKWKRYDRAIGEIAEILWQYYPGFTAVDIGANIGDTAAVISGNHDVNILCIEGASKFIPILEENISKFNSKVEIHRGFVYAEDELSDENFYCDGSVSLAKNLDKIEASRSKENKSLSAILKMYPDFGNPKLIKIDTDGMDFYIIRNSLDVFKRLQPVLFFEYALEFRDDAVEESIAAIIDMVSCGYKAFIVYDNYGNLLTTVSKDYENRFKELNLYLISNHNNGVSVFYFDVCAVHENDIGLAEEIVNAAHSNNSIENKINISEKNKYHSEQHIETQEKKFEPSETLITSETRSKLDSIKNNIAAKKYDDAQLEINELLKSNCNDVNILNEIAVAQILLRRWEEASITLTEILDIEPQNETAIESVRYLEKQLLYYRAILESEKLIQANDLDGAEKILKEILKSDSQNLDALNNLAVVKIYNNEFESAENYLNDVLRIDATNELAIENLIQLNIIRQNETV